jgi:hypothetical protein
VVPDMSDAWIIVLIYAALLFVSICIGVIIKMYLDQEELIRRRSVRRRLRSPFDDPSTVGGS